ncbi:methylmalonyl-CoA mutase family protein [Breoghania sp. L-A4]|uniref:methylmalonyl-CoA mutase family protein n=1 Tax=Breoghania sp. L-A4 TaxID=2304600 RepID=UPI0019688D5C|nr:methylmalonyl-CoA mutase family protein [Breoghania sp. L-A4]
MSSSNHARGSGIVVDTFADLETLLGGVHLDLISLRLNAGHECRPLIAMLLELAGRRGHDIAALDIRAAVDPIAAMVQSGRQSAPLERLAPRLQDLAHYLEDRGLKGSVTKADGRVWHAAGASDAQELGYTLASAVTYLRLLDDAGIAGFVPQDRVDVALAADTDQFGTIAKIRAMRRLWARVLDASGLEQRPLHIHAETAWRMMTRRDPWVNMLRGTVACFAAGVGGADSVTVLPFTEALGVPDSFARRIARNIQTILLEESNVHRVADPAAGSGAVEARTQQLVQEAWALFQDAEAAGGIERAYVDGRITPGIVKVRDERLQRVATRRDPLTGTSAFANLDERPVSVVVAEPVDLSASSRSLELPPPGKGDLMRALVDAVRDGASVSEMTLARGAPSRTQVEALPPMRLAEPYEALRDAADCSFAATGARPAVFLATIGGAADHAARSGWARTLFAAGASRRSRASLRPRMQSRRWRRHSRTAAPASRVSAPPTRCMPTMPKRWRGR